MIEMLELILHCTLYCCFCHPARCGGGGGMLVFFNDISWVR